VDLELNIAQVAYSFLSNYSLGPGISHIRDPCKKARSMRAENWCDCTDRVQNNFLGYHDEQVRFRNEICSDQHISELPSILARYGDNPYVVLFDGIRGPACVSGEFRCPIPGRKITPLWAVGCRRGVNRLWVFHPSTVYEIGNHTWSEIPRAEFADSCRNVRFCYVSYGNAAGHTVDLHTNPIRVYCDCDSDAFAHDDFLRQQVEFEHPYTPLSLDWAKTFLKQALLYRGFYLRQCPAAFDREGEDIAPDALDGEADGEYESFKRFVLSLVQFLELVCKGAEHSERAFEQFERAMASLPARVPLLQEFVLSLVREIAIDLQDEGAEEDAERILQALVIARGAEYLREILPDGAAETADDRKGPEEDAAPRVQPPAADEEEIENVFPREIVQRMLRVFSQGRIRECGASLEELSWQFDPENDDRKDGQSGTRTRPGRADETAKLYRP
jgi:hypothetical protein